MKTLVTLLSAAFLALSFNSCTWLKEKYAKNEAATTTYLAEKKTASAKINVEGLWYSPQWGIVVLNQEPGGKLSGIFRDYYMVNGVVSGRNAYIALVDDDWTEYTVELRRINSEKLKGYFSSHVPFNESDQQEVVLTRID